ncbi:AHSA1 [Cordylochernes scorpioides]|uniref:AHSA1 n=1 Tax=Cordylochernes scorpioides TaxID=51811 RepID=A0ABY6LP85_9ARAC|nr:AHSA1 [Cordylochernes scorpioides]
MAKWGEGDPRWIVEERPDATNVNNWHWTEKNASPWSKDKLSELLGNLKIEDKIGYCQVTDISKCEGEAVANNRKAKLIFFYEWNIELKWKGFLSGCNKEIEGTITIPNLSEENEPDEIDVAVALTSSDSEGDLLKEMIRKKGAEEVRAKLKEYISCLKQEFSQGMILPSKTSNTQNSQGKTRLNVAKAPSSATPASGKSKKTNGGVPLQLETLTMKESFKCTAEELYRVFTIPEMVQAFTQDSCVLEPQPGGKFSLLGGNITGTFVELVPDTKIVQKWRYKLWPEGHLSDVEMAIDQKESSTEITLTQRGVPRNDLDQTRNGWQRFYWDSIKRTFGFGVSLF